MAETFACPRCKRELPTSDAQRCWWCCESLCYDCWEELGHCGHPEAEEENRKARASGKRDAGEDE